MHKRKFFQNEQS